jgi:murein DD-endopeptidase MepM/ murein hydrolase activator NlpD/LysM repeat protein
MLHSTEKFQELDAKLAELAASAPPEAPSRTLEVVAAMGVGSAVMLGGTGVAVAHEVPASGTVAVERGSNLTDTFEDYGLTLEQGLAIPANARYRANPDFVKAQDIVDVVPDTSVENQIAADGVLVGVIGEGHTTWGFANHVGVDESQVMKAVQFDLDKIKPGQRVIFERDGQWQVRTIAEGDTIGAIALAERARASSFRMLVDYDRSKVWEGDILAAIKTESPETVQATTQGMVTLPEGGSAWNIAEKLVPLTPEADTVAGLANSIVAANDQDPTKYQVGQALIVPGISQEVIDRAMTAPAEPPVIVEAVSMPQGSIQDVFTPDAVTQILPNAPRENVEAYTPLVLNALAEQGIDNPQVVSYAFATINAETSEFAPIHEYASGMAYEPHTRVGQRLGNTQEGDGPRYRGRGFVQLTGRNNYRHMGEVLGIDLENNPDLALQPETAARILAVFLAERQDRLVPALEENDMVAARRVVNGGTHGINRMVSAYETATTIAENVVENPVIAEPITEVDTPPVTPESVTELPAALETPVTETPVPSEPEQATEEHARAEDEQHDHDQGSEDQEAASPEVDTEDQGSAPVTDAPGAAVVEATPAPAPLHSVAGETLAHPVGEEYRITSDFGPREAPRTSGGRGSTNHRGTDYGTPIGTPVRAPQDGVVESVSSDNRNGNLLIIDHGPNSQGQDVDTIYAHLNEVLVEEGEHVEQGEEVARTGNTGNSGGPHLHQGVRIGGQHVDPEDVIDGPKL